MGLVRDFGPLDLPVSQCMIMRTSMDLGLLIRALD
jgi:hypothetical protein